MRSLVLPIVLLVGCSWLDKAKETIDDYTNPLVAEGIMLGVAAPESDQIDLSGTDYADGATFSMFLADAASVDDLESAVIGGAYVQFKASSTGSLTASDEGAGLYLLTSADGLEYTPGEEFTVSASKGDVSGKVSMSEAQPVDLTLDETHEPNQALTIDLSTYDYDSALVVVVDMTTGGVTFSNQPEDIKGVYDFTHGDGSVKKVTIPGDAFSEPNGSVYAVGVAGMKVASGDAFDGVNTLLSSMMTGQLVFSAVSTLPDLPQ